MSNLFYLIFEATLFLSSSGSQAFGSLLAVMYMAEVEVLAEDEVLEKKKKNVFIKIK
jgi:hypothetical protein